MPTEDSLEDKVDRGRGHIERFRAPRAVRDELTRFITQGGSLVWSRPGLVPAQRSLVTISVLAARGDLGPLREHMQIGLGNGLTPTEIIEALIQCSVYAGFPAMVAAMEVAADVLDADSAGSE